VSNRRNAVLGIAAIAGAIAVAGCSDNTHGDQSTLKLVEPGGNSGTFGIIGQAAQKSVPPGSGFAFSTPLQDSSKKAVGALDATCIATQPSPGDSVNGQCTGTATVPGGTLALDVGGKDIGSDVAGAITGGTGKYAGATGTFTSQATGGGDNSPSNDTFNITLP
jgi:hypothetical protein